MKSSSGRPYSVPTNKPSYTFVKDKTKIDVYYNQYNVELFQFNNGSFQRLNVSHNDYENFEARLKENGFQIA